MALPSGIPRGRGRQGRLSLREGAELAVAPQTAPSPWVRGPERRRRPTYLPAEELPDQGGGHLLHEEAVHAAGSAHEAAPPLPRPRSVGASMAALPW